MQAPKTSRPTETTPSLQEMFAEIKDELAEVDRLVLETVESDVDVIETSSQYIHESGGKRVRPALLLLAARLFGHREPKAHRYAAVMEMVHTATLVHDDIVDKATLRRGQTSVNSLFGNDVTVLLGDYLYIRSMRLAIELGSLEVLQIICNATLRMIEGMIRELVRGGAIDLTDEEHLGILERKTAALFSACARIGGVVAGASEEHQRALADYGMNFGMAFQVVDDLLDFTSNEEVLGKPVLQDLKEGHITLPIIYALRAEPSAAATVEAVVRSKSIDETNRIAILDLVHRCRGLDLAREVAGEFALKAKHALDPIPESASRDSLLALADFVVDRNR